jgi:hypothetical protein
MCLKPCPQHQMQRTQRAIKATTDQLRLIERWGLKASAETQIHFVLPYRDMCGEMARGEDRIVIPRTRPRRGGFRTLKRPRRAIFNGFWTEWPQYNVNLWNDSESLSAADRFAIPTCRHFRVQSGRKSQ